MQIGIQLWGCFLRSSLNLSQASNKDSSSPCLSEVISFLILVFLVGRKYLAKTISTKIFHTCLWNLALESSTNSWLDHSTNRGTTSNWRRHLTCQESWSYFPFPWINLNAYEGLHLQHLSTDQWLATSKTSLVWIRTGNNNFWSNNSRVHSVWIKYCIVPDVTCLVIGNANDFVIFHDNIF